jgi:hypothetical protein
MKKLLIIFLGLMFIMPVTAVSHDKINISRNGSTFNVYRSMHPFVLVMNNNNIMVLWEEGPIEKECDIVYRILDTKTNTWTPGLNSRPDVAVKRIRSASFPMAVESSDGVIHVSYQDGDAQSNRDAFYIYYKDGVWSPRERVARTIQNSAWPRIALDKETDEIYVTWHHQHALGSHASDIVFCKRNMKTGKWSIIINFSKTANVISLHQASTFTKGRLHTIWQDGKESNWKIMANSALGQATVSAVGTAIDLPGAENGYWPELSHDNLGNLYGIFSNQKLELFYAFKAVDGKWVFGGLLNKGGRKDFFGLNVAQNGVAYAIHQVGYDSGWLPVFIRFTHGNISKRITINDNAKYPKRFHLDIDDEGAVHAAWSDFPAGDSAHTDDFPSDVWYQKVDQQGGPKIKITANVDTAITNESITFTGATTSEPNAILTHWWYINKNILESTTSTLTKTFTSPGTYTIHYYVADSDNLLGHTSYTLEVLDVPYKPQNTSYTIDVIKAYLYRGFINHIRWDDDSRNGSKFTNLDHFNVYKRNVGSTDWGTAVGKVNYTAAGAQYIDKSAVFSSRSDASKYEYAVTIVAIINGQEKESKITVITYGETATSYRGRSLRNHIL